MSAVPYNSLKSKHTILHFSSHHIFAANALGIKSDVLNEVSLAAKWLTPHPLCVCICQISAIEWNFDFH